MRQHLQPAIDAGGNTHTFEDVIIAVLRGDMQLWHAPDGSAVTQINEHPARRSIHWIWAGGNLDQVLDFQDSVRAFGRAHGCTEMTLAGRNGWQRALKAHGWEAKGVIMGASL